jgi:hypothetical protein
VVCDAEGDERVGREASPGLGGVEVDELIGADGVLGAADIAKHLVERDTKIEVTQSLSHALLVRLLLRKAERLDGADVTQSGRGRAQ